MCEITFKWKYRPSCCCHKHSDHVIYVDKRRRRNKNKQTLSNIIYFVAMSTEAQENIFEI